MQGERAPFLAVGLEHDQSLIPPNPTVNRVELVGYVGTLPERRFLADETLCVRLSVATHYQLADHPGEQQLTEWHQVITFGSVAKQCRQLLPGTLVRVSGHLHTRSWVDRRHVRHASTEIIADQVVVAHPRPWQHTLPLGVPA
jgi:single-strand DNA-binding protein